MIASALLGSWFLPVVFWSLLCWVAGVAWAAYRAVGWVERMRSWAASVETEESCSFSGAPLAGAARLRQEADS